MKRLLVFLLLASAVSAQRSYRTNAPTTENPLSQNSNWINGLATGLDWGDVRSSSGTPGVFFGTNTTATCPGGVNGCNDSTTVLSGAFAADQYACATVYLDTTLNRNSNFYESELRLRTTIGAHSITGYEINFAQGSDGGTHQYTQIVKWNGAKDNFLRLNGVTLPAPLQNGDRVCASAIGTTNTTITVYLNGTQINQKTDNIALSGTSPWTTGNPGMGFFNQGGTSGDNAHYGFSRFDAYDNVQLAASCNTTDIQTAVTAAAVGGTVMIPAGSCTWSAGGISINKSINVTSLGTSGRIVATDNNIETLTIGTGSRSIIIGTYSPGFGAGQWLVGSTFRISHNNDRANWMQGTVTSFSAGTLVLNITSNAGSGTFHQWLISKQPTTTLINNTTSTMWPLTEPTTGNGILFSDFKIVKGTSASTTFLVSASVGGIPTLFHDMWMEQPAADAIDTTTNKGVGWALSIDGSTANNNQLATTAILRIKGGTNTWTTASTWGAADTTGTNAIYFENSDFHALQAYTDNDDNGKMVFRYNVMDTATFSTHGADTSNVGQRYFEFYNNTGIYKGYGDGTSMNLPNGWLGLIRGGSFVMHDNTLDVINSFSDFGTKNDVNMTVMNLGRNAGPNPCWGLNTTGGSVYHAPRQVGMGRVTGTGTDGLGRANDSITYVGDLEPVYMWNNSRTPTITLSDYSSLATNYCGPTPDLVANYIVSGRDFINSGTAKPSYTAYTYPHPLENSFTVVAQAAQPTFSPVAGTYSSTQNVAISTTSGTVICYNTTGSPATNGTTGCATGTLYTTPISVSTNQTLFAVAGGTGLLDSTIGSAAYTITTSSGIAFTPVSPLNIGNQSLNSPSSGSTLIVTNTGGATLTFTSVTLVGGNAGDFAILSNGCSPSLAPSLSCNIVVNTTPTALGARTTTLQFVTNAPTSPDSYTLNSTGVFVTAPAVQMVSKGTTGNISGSYTVRP